MSHIFFPTLICNVAIREMGGPKIPTRFGRVDAKSHKDSVESQVGRLPDGDKKAQHLRDIFYPKGFNDREIVALSGAHTLGACHLHVLMDHGRILLRSLIRLSSKTYLKRSINR